MPRSPDGSFSLVAGNPVVTGETIDSDWANTTLPDIAQALTESLSRTGEGGMLVPFRFLDGTNSNPGITWTNELNSGFYRAATNDFRATIAGTDSVRFRVNGIDIWNGSEFKAVLTDVALADYLPLAGGTMAGVIEMGTNPINFGNNAGISRSGVTGLYFYGDKQARLFADVAPLLIRPNGEASTVGQFVVSPDQTAILDGTLSTDALDANDSVTINKSGTFVQSRLVVEGHRNDDSPIFSIDATNNSDASSFSYNYGGDGGFTAPGEVTGHTATTPITLSSRAAKATTGSDADSDFFRDPSTGYTRCFGTAAAVPAGGNTVVNLLVTFDTVPDAGATKTGNSSDGNNVTIGRTATTVTIYNHTASARDIGWYAEGFSS